MSQLLLHLSHTTQCTTTHQAFRLKWLHRATLQGLHIKDPQGDTMLVADELSLQLNPLQLLLNPTIVIQKIYIQGAQCHLRKEAGATYNVETWLQRLMGERPSTSSKAVPPLVLESVVVQDLTLSIDDQEAPLLQDRFDWQHCTLHHIHAELAHWTVQGNKLTGDLLHLAGQHATLPLALAHCSASLAVAPGRLQCKAFDIRAGSSALQGYCTVTYNPQTPSEEWIHQAHITAHLDHTLLAAEDLGIFIPYFKQHQATYTLQGQLEGQLHDLSFQDFRLELGQRNHLHAYGNVRGLPHWQETTFDIEFKHGICYAADLLPYIPEAQQHLITPFVFVKAKGHLQGTLDDFTAQATFDTDLGKVTTNLDLKIPAAGLATYQGSIAVDAFALGALLHNDTLQKLSMQGKIDGKGLQLSTAQFWLEADITQLGLHDYNYQRIYTKGRFAHAFFQGKLTIDDPHLKLQADATVDWHQEHIAVRGTLEQASLQPLRLTDRPVDLRTQVSLNLQGLSLDNLQAALQLQQLHVALQDKPLQLEALQINMRKEGDGGRALRLDSEWCAAEVIGNFSYLALAKDLQQFVQAYWRRWRHETPVSYTPQPCALTYHVHCKDINPLLGVLAPTLYLAPQTRLTGSFVQQEDAQLVVHLTDAESFTMGNTCWHNIGFDLTAYQTSDGRTLTATGQLTSAEQQWETEQKTANFMVAFDWKNDQIDFSHTWDQTSQQHRLNLQGQALLLKHTIEVSLQPPTRLEVAGTLWHVHPDHCIVIGPSWTQFKNVTFDNGIQKLGLLGVLSADPTTTLHLTVQNFDISNFNPLLHQSLEGVLNASVALQGTFKQPLINSDLLLQDLVVDGFSVDHVQAHTRWDNARQRLHVDVQLTRAQQAIVSVQGFYTPTQQDQSLQLTAQFTHTPLAILTPLVKGQLSQLQGELNSTLHIQGSPAQPRFEGQVSITEAAAKVDYLDTHYQLEGSLTCTAQRIHLTSLDLTDDQQGTAKFQGTLSYQALTTPQLDLKGDLQHFKVLETSASTQAYVYGTSLMTGQMSVQGPISNLAVQARARTAPGTEVFIVLQQAISTIVQQDFINFVKFNAVTDASSPKTLVPVALQGLQFTLMLEITPDANAELILNATTKDTIRGKGKGNLKLTLDLEENLSMAGDFAFTEGECRVTLYRFVKKNFAILPGSKITWYEQPEQGILDVRAAYEQRVSLAPLMLGSRHISAARTKYPVQVRLALTGPLVAPEIGFDIQCLARPKDAVTQNVVDTLHQRIKTDENYLNTQVASLVIANRFYDDQQNFNQSAGDNVLGSVSGLVSDQLNNLASQLNENLAVDADVDLTMLEKQGLESLQLNLSYRFLDGRLTLSREGGINVDTRGNLIGNLTAEYLLTEDGSLRAKLYNKQIAPSTHSIKNKQGTFTGGFSLVYTTSFNRWRELFRFRKNFNKEAPQAEQ